MPQLDPTFFASQIFWLCLSFALLFVLMQFWALPSVTKIIENRRQRIEGDLKQAAKIQKDIERLNKNCEEALAKTKQETSTMIKTRLDELKNYHQSREAELAVTLQNHLKAAEAKVSHAKAEALKEIESAVGELSQSMMTKLIGDKLSQDIILRETKKTMENNRGL